MNWPPLIREVLARDDDVFVQYRDPVLMKGGFIGLLVLTPFLVNNVLQGRFGLAAIMSVAQLLLLIDVVAIRRGRPAPLPFWLLLLPVTAGMLRAMQIQGIYGALWSYPVVMCCYFVLGRRLALLVSLAIMLVTTTAVARLIDPLLAIRIFATLALTIGLTHVALTLTVRLHRDLVKQTLIDPLTGAFNRRHMGRTLGGMVDPSPEGKPRPLANALLALDVDEFKSINDSLGHDAGDRVLREVVRLIQSRKRGADLLFRSGGEEFTLLLLDVDRGGAYAAAEGLRKTIASATILAERPVTVSIGVCMQSPALSHEQWLKRADQALYRAKAAGRNRVEMADEAHPVEGSG